MMEELATNPRTATISSRHQSLENLENFQWQKLLALILPNAFLPNHFKGEFSQNSHLSTA